MTLPPTTARKWMYRLNIQEANVSGAIFHFFSASLVVAAALSNDWIVVENMKNSTDTTSNIFSYPLPSNVIQCETVGCRMFWMTARIGAYVDRLGKTHMAFHDGSGNVILDCVTPLIANIFYFLISLCCIICITSSFCCAMNICPPNNNFLQWLRRNTILEMSNMLLTLCACVLAIIAQTEVVAQRPHDDVTVGFGVFLVCLAGLQSFLAAMSNIRHMTHLNRLRRMDNQRLLCARSLRSWRDPSRRSEDRRPIVDFERYLDSCIEDVPLPESSTSA